MNLFFVSNDVTPDIYPPPVSKLAYLLNLLNQNSYFESVPYSRQLEQWGRGGILVYPPGRKFSENTAPEDFEKRRNFVPEIEEKGKNFV